MAANATTKIQVNYGKDGLLVNIYADNAKELEELLTTVHDTASLLESVGTSIGRLVSIFRSPIYCNMAHSQACVLFDIDVGDLDVPPLPHPHHR